MMETRHIVIADDEVLLCITIADILRHEGYRVTAVRDGSEVLPLLEREKVDLVLLDLMMPQMHGLKALELIKQRSPQAKVIMLSGYGTTADIEQAKRLGADSFIDKPLGVETLKRRIREVLAGGLQMPFHEPPIE